LALEAKMQKFSKAFNEEQDLMKKLLYVCEALTYAIDDFKENYENYIATWKKL
jgi:hypothetical protein